jgi:hypothetical protein
MSETVKFKKIEIVNFTPTFVLRKWIIEKSDNFTKVRLTYSPKRARRGADGFFCLTVILDLESNQEPDSKPIFFSDLDPALLEQRISDSN